MSGPYTALRQGIPWFDPEQSLASVLQLVVLAYAEHQAIPRRNVGVYYVVTSPDMDAQLLVLN